MLAEHLEIWFFATDKGGDQVGSEPFLDKDFQGNVFVWKIRRWCIRHQLHLMVRRQLQRLKNLFPRSAKLTNVWRSFGRKMYRAFKELFQDLSKALNRLPPRPLTGRWGYIDDNSKYLLAAGYDRVPIAFRKAVIDSYNSKTSVRKQTNNKKTAGIDAVDEHEESFSDKRGRWVREVDEYIDTPEFWREVELGVITRAPEAHMESWLESTDPLPKPKTMMYVCVVAERIGSEWELMLEPDVGTTIFADVLAREDSSPENMHEVIALTVMLVIEMYTDYYQRILVDIRDFPSQLLVLGFADPSIACHRRRDVARALLDSLRAWLMPTPGHPPVITDPTSIKCAYIFEEFLTITAETGMLNPRMYEFVNELAEEWPLDTQLIEGKNNTVASLVAHRYVKYGLDTRIERIYNT